MAALSVALFGLGYFWTYQSDNARERQSAAEHSAQYQPQQIQAECVQVPRTRTFTCTATPPDSGGGEYYTQADLKAQQQMAEWAFAMFIATCVGALITFAGVAYVAMTLAATRDAVEETANAAQAAQDANETFAAHAQAELRAYVGLVDAQSHVPRPGQPQKVTLRFVNSGQTPARNVMLIAAAGVFPVNFGGDLCNMDIASLPEESEPFGYREIPGNGGDTRIDAITDVLTPNEAMQINSGTAGVFVFGRGAYKDVFGNWHWLRYQAYFTQPPERGAFPLYFTAVGNGS